MHMADALLSPAVALAMDAVALASIGVSVRRIKNDEFCEKKIPIMGVAGAMVFAGQMINFAIPATGSSGHIGGGILLAGLLGGVPAFLSIAAVLIIQCIFFADGGLLALGCNIFNIGVIPCLVMYPLVFKPILKGRAGYRRLTVASIVSAILGLGLGAFCVVLQTLFSGITELPFGAFSALMLPLHIAIGLVEGVVTAAVLCFVYKMRPEIIDSVVTGEGLGGVSTKKVLVLLAALTIVVGGALSLAASASPDGLEWAIGKTSSITLDEETVIEARGAIFEKAANAQESAAILPDYSFPSDPDNAAGTSVSGIIGASITFVLAGATGLVVSKMTKRKKAKAIG
ncbi:MAG: energy-coupling factor ABC transporter permease [Oscillospiraceae bacterium]|jgi:cobalt/nickel transport system permease protein|nr:energy-coupling factor ABC transporter permease [Oscillospiraceae bacterium]